MVCVDVKVLIWPPRRRLMRKMPPPWTFQPSAKSQAEAAALGWCCCCYRTLFLHQLLLLLLKRKLPEKCCISACSPQSRRTHCICQISAAAVEVLVLFLALGQLNFFLWFFHNLAFCGFFYSLKFTDECTLRMKKLGISETGRRLSESSDHRDFGVSKNV